MGLRSSSVQMAGRLAEVSSLLSSSTMRNAFHCGRSRELESRQALSAATHPLAVEESLSLLSFGCFAAPGLGPCSNSA